MAGSADRRRALGLCVGLAFLLWPQTGPAKPDLFSPGELSKAHAALDGVSKCTQCHVAGGQLSAERCLDCHTELKTRMAEGKGFHGKLVPAEKASCATCHHEHQGRDFALVDWAGPQKQFDHRRTGFVLAGKHRKAECASCHDERRVQDPAVRALEQKTHRKSFLGLGTSCASCHFDEHRAQLGADCQRCHTEQGFVPAAFDHAKAGFALQGKHANVECLRCHAKEPDKSLVAGTFPAPVHAEVQRFKPVAHASCTACHQDAHEGRFGTDCARCHQPTAWREVKTSGETKTGGTFHDGTRFPLRGAHAEVACKLCHGPFAGEKARFKGLAFDRCDRCHLDAHVGQLSLVQGQKRDCEACHTVETFANARFDVEEHARTRFALTGAHRAVPCLSCHLRDEHLASQVPATVRAEWKKEGRAVRVSPAVFRETGKLDDCRTCHADAHAGQFMKRVDAEGCTACHTLDRFHPARFDHAKDSRFPLEGKHATVSCARCHALEKVKPVL
ncbi:MAG: hypothetical protein JST92_27870, partial [Deltaproteobacteria bacterium]|nr:hypothetical protein [Deltaproteobacteria bacterium]